MVCCGAGENMMCAVRGYEMRPNEGFLWRKSRAQSTDMQLGMGSRILQLEGGKVDFGCGSAEAAESNGDEVEWSAMSER